MKYVEPFSEGSGTEQALISGGCYHCSWFVLVVSDYRRPGEGAALNDPGWPEGTGPVGWAREEREA